MTNFEGDNLDFSDLNLPGIEAFDENAELPEEVPAEPIKPEVEPSAQEEQAEQEETVEAEPKEEQSKRVVYIEWGLVACVPAILLAIAWLGLLNFSLAIYLIAVGAVPYGLWKGGETKNFFTIILACTLIAVLTAVYFMWCELGRYGFDVKARDGKHRISMSSPLPAVSAFDRPTILHS